MGRAVRRLPRVLFTAALLVVAAAGPALAAWNAGSSGATGLTKADGLPAGNAPTSVTRLGRDADVTWTQVSFGRQLLGSYSTGRYTLARSGAAAGGGCPAALAPGSAASSTCRETGLAPGTYAYTVTPWLAGWSGAARDVIRAANRSRQRG